MDLISQKASKIILYKHGEIPILKLLNLKKLSGLGNLFSFSSIDPNPDMAGASITLLGGIYKKDDNEFAVPRLSIEERKVVIMIEGPSEIAQEAIVEMRNFLSELAGNTDVDYLTPVIVTDETEILSYLNISIDKLISPVLNKIIYKDAKALAESEFAEASIGGIVLGFPVDYSVKDKSLGERRINLTRKEIVLQNATGYLSNEKIYTSKAPLTTTDHIKLLKKLEASL